MEDIKIMNRR